MGQQIFILVIMGVLIINSLVGIVFSLKLGYIYPIFYALLINAGIVMFSIGLYGLASGHNWTVIGFMCMLVPYLVCAGVTVWTRRFKSN